MAIDPQVLQRFEDAGDLYRERFGAGPPMLAFEAMAMEQVFDSMERAIATGKPVPGWRSGFETSIQNDTGPEASQPLQSTDAHIRER